MRKRRGTRVNPVKEMKKGKIKGRMSRRGKERIKERKGNEDEELE